MILPQTPKKDSYILSQEKTIMKKEEGKKKSKLRLKRISKPNEKLGVHSLNEVREVDSYTWVAKNITEEMGFPPCVKDTDDCLCCEGQLFVLRHGAEEPDQSTDSFGQVLTIINHESGSTSIFTRSLHPSHNGDEWTPWLMVATGDPKLVAENTSINEALSTLRRDIEAEQVRAKDAEASLLARTTVRFHRIVEKEHHINAGEIESSPTEIVYYKPSNIFVAVDNAGNYWDTWEGVDAYMDGNTVHKNKLYICGGQSYTWNGIMLCDVSEKVNASLLAEINRATNAEETLLQLINSIKPVEYSGTFFNAPDEEDITEEDNMLKLKDRPWGDGMGYVILRKSKSLQEQLINENTIYEVRYDFDLNGEEITVPNNSVLNFSGGTISDGVLIFNDSFKIVGTGLKCKVRGIKCRVNLKWFCIETPECNRELLQYLIDEGYSVGLEPDMNIVISGPISVKSKIQVSCNNSSIKRGTFPTISFPYSDGFVWDSKSYSQDNLLENLKITAKGYCINLSNTKDKEQRPYNIYMSTFRNLSLHSDEKDCIYAHDNRGTANDRLCFQNIFDDIYVSAPKGCGINGVNGLGNFFTNITDYNIAESLFHNVYGVIRDCNTSFSASRHFLSYDSDLYQSYGITLEIINCNMERYIGEVIYSDPDMPRQYGFYVKLDNVSIIYTPVKDKDFMVESNILEFYPVSIVGLSAININRLSTYFTEGAISEEYRLFKWMPSGSQEISVTTDIPYPTHCYLSKDSKVDYLFDSFTTDGDFLYSVDYLDRGARNIGRLKISDYIKIAKSIYTPLRIDVTEYHNDYSKQFIANLANYIEVTSTEATRIVNINRREIGGHVNLIEVVTIHNAGEYDITFESTNFVGTTTRNFFTKSGKDLVLKPGGAVVLSCAKDVSGNIVIKELYRYDSNMNAGTTQFRPQLASNEEGFCFYDTTLKKPIWWDGTKWIDATGAEV